MAENMSWWSAVSASVLWSPDQANLFRRLMQNVLSAPTDPKFRRLRLGNARIAGLVEAAPGARQAMEALGWVASCDDDGGAILELPVTANLKPITAVVQAFPAAPEAVLPKAANPGEPWTVTVLRGPLRTKLELFSTATLTMLAQAIEQSAPLGRIPQGRQSLLVGYPPRPLSEQLEVSSAATLEGLNLRSVMLQDLWEDLCGELRNERASFVQIADSLARPAIADLGLRMSRDFLNERARARLRSHTLRMPVEEVQMARCIFKLLGVIPGEPATRGERLAFCADCAAATALRGTGAPVAGSPELDDDDSSEEGEPLELVVERMSILESALPQIRHTPPRELRKPLEVRFANEAAEDAGGPRREFFNEFGRAAAAARGLWRLTPAGSLVPTAKEVSSQQVPDPNIRHDFYQSCGRVCGMALHHTSRPPCLPMLIGLPLAHNFIRALQGDEPQSLDELQAEFNVEQHESAPDFRGSAVFRTSSLRNLGLEGQLTFSCQDIHGCVVDLTPSGRTIIVTDETKETWLDLTLRYVLFESIREAANAFRKGVCEVLGGAHFVLLGAGELSDIWSGRGVITDQDLIVWRSKTEVSPAVTTQAQWLFELLAGDLSEARGRVLKFATGSDRWPVDTSGFTFAVEPMDGGDADLPCAMTCGNMLQLPRYSCPGSLRERLLKAVDLGLEMQRT